MGANRRPHSNLESFLDSITPSLKVRLAPKSCFNDLNLVHNTTCKEDMVEYFTLNDFWERYYEWSACGAAVPIRLDNGKLVTQYYSPTLSAIQIYREKASPRSEAEDDTASEELTDDTGNEKLSRSSSSTSSSFLSEELGSEAGNLYFQFTESVLPYQRKPLFEKVHELAKDHPGLLSFKSVEISSASWFSVAWYPIYHTPGQRNIKELSAAFLTYHSFYSSFQDNTSEEKLGNCVVGATKMNKHISFFPFGLATYKMPSSKFWINPETGDEEMMTYLLYGADSCVKEHNVEQKDYKFFSVPANWRLH